jgi:hypothetical protein
MNILNKQKMMRKGFTFFYQFSSYAKIVDGLIYKRIQLVDKGEWHESGSDKGIAIVIQSEKLNPESFMRMKEKE